MSELLLGFFPWIDLTQKINHHNSSSEQKIVKLSLLDPRLHVLDLHFLRQLPVKYSNSIAGKAEQLNQSN